MRFNIHFESAQLKDKVTAHLWNKTGNTLDIPGKSNDFRNFHFNVDTDKLEGNSLKLKLKLKLKFKFPNEINKWEHENYVRELPSPDTKEVWTFEYSSRCLVKPPQGPVVKQIMFNIIQENEFTGSTLLAWNPGADNIQEERDFFPETFHHNTHNISQFAIVPRPWMIQGFHFKLVDKNKNIWEPDSNIRIWRPIDGSEIWYKNGQINPSLQSSGFNEVQKSSEIKDKTKEEEMTKCGATTKSGKACNNRAMSNGFCQMHKGKAEITQKLPELEEKIVKTQEAIILPEPEIPVLEKEKIVVKSASWITGYCIGRIGNFFINPMHKVKIYISGTTA